jgi:hypothetical protein
VAVAAVQQRGQPQEQAKRQALAARHRVRPEVVGDRYMYAPSPRDAASIDTAD